MTNSSFCHYLIIQTNCINLIQGQICNISYYSKHIIAFMNHDSWESFRTPIIKFDNIVCILGWQPSKRMVNYTVPYLALKTFKQAI